MNHVSPRWRFGVALLFATSICNFVQGQTVNDCRTIAAPPPLATFGGPATVAAGESEMAFGAGFGGTLFDCTHKTGLGWFGRLRYGVSDRADVGVDVLAAQHQDKSVATAKLAFRYQLRKRLRLELGFGGADDSDGKSLNADLGITTGTIRDKTWNHFASLRFAAARGFPGSTCCFGSGSGSNVPPGNYLAMGTIGATARISDNARFVYEVGFGGVLTHFADRSEIGKVVYIGVGVMFHTRKDRD